MIRNILRLFLLAVMTLTAGAEEMITGTGVVMVLVPAGTFTMGSKSGKPNEQPEHKVTVSAFYLDKFEVKQGDYEKMTGMNPSKFGGKENPVEQVRWFEAALYCNERSRREKLVPCYDEKTWVCSFNASGYRLPTEAEWEYAARAGSQIVYPGGNDVMKVGDFGWFKDNAEKKAHPAGMKKANAFGLFDMSGNLWEWCNDFYQEDYYTVSPSADPRGPENAKKRVLRGGSWGTTTDTLRFSYRLADDPANADICQGYDTYGFRCVRRP